MVSKLIVEHVNTLKILTINAWGVPFNTTRSKRISLLINQILKVDADVVLIQECWIKYDYNKIIEGCSYPFATPYGDFPFIGLFTGLIILSKYPITKATKIGYNWKTIIPNLVKGALKAEIIFCGQKINIFNTHLTANLEVSLGNETNIWGKIMFARDKEEITRKNQLETLSFHLNESLSLGIPTILGGDLNTGPNYPLWYEWLNYLKTNYKDLYDSMSYTKNIESTYKNNFCARDQGQLDHIIAFSKTKIQDTRIVFTKKCENNLLTKN